MMFVGAGVAVLVLLWWLLPSLIVRHKKSFSPEETVAFALADASIKVVYNRPFKKNRVIFGALVPYGKVWRTGANEATTFSCSRDLSIKGAILKAGTYTLWTIPNEESWSVIFNSEFGQWGIDSKGDANRDPERDALEVTVPVAHYTKVIEQFTIAFDPVGDDAEMVFLWDDTVVAVPLSLAKP